MSRLIDEPAGCRPARNDTAEGRAKLVSDPAATAAAAALPWAECFGPQDVGAMIGALEEFTERVAKGDTAALQAKLAGHFAVLDAVFTNLVRLAASSADAGPNLRLALRAQRQAAQTARAISELQHPTGFIGRQVNIAANGGQQQVNNDRGALAGSRVRARSETGSIELLEPSDEHKRLDARAAGGAGKSDPQLETVEELDRSTHCRRQGTKLEERVPRGSAPEPTSSAQQALGAVAASEFKFGGKE